MAFWDFAAPFYDRAEQTNAQAYDGMLQLTRKLVPEGAAVFEAAAGTGSVSIALADKAKRILCTDLSQRMLYMAQRKANQQGISNIEFSVHSIFETGEPDNSYDIVIASQILHLIDEPQKAAAELKRIARTAVITPVCLLKGLHGFFPKQEVAFWRVLGFAPRREFDADGYRRFLAEIGLPPSRFEIINGNMPMAVSVYEKE